MTERVLAAALRSIAEDARPARLPDDLWSRGRRHRLRRGVAAAVALAVVALTPLVMWNAALGRPEPAAPAGASQMVPSTVYPPWPWYWVWPRERTVLEAPAGPAAVLVDGAGAFVGGEDIMRFESRSLVVTPENVYRVLRSIGSPRAGENMLLSPDGRYIAIGAMTEDPDATLGTTAGATGNAVVDLVSGEVRGRGARSGGPVAWSPDGRYLLALLQGKGYGSQLPSGAFVGGTLTLEEVATGATRELMVLPEVRVHSAWLAAFSPDGQRIAVQTGTTLHLVDVAAGTVTTLADLGPRRRLAGTGAWLPDGRRIAVLDLDGCADRCDGDADALNGRTFRIGYLDARLGTPAAGPRLDPMTGLALRILGWRRDGAAVTAVFRTDGDQARYTVDDAWSEAGAVTAVELVALHPDGGRSRLVTLPADARSVDVPSSLLDSFGGPAPPRAEGIARSLASSPLLFVLLAAAGTMILLAAGLRRRRHALSDPAP